MFSCRDIAKGQENSIAGVIVLGVKIAKLLITQVRNMCGVATTVEVVGVAREKFIAQSVPQNGRGR